MNRCVSKNDKIRFDVQDEADGTAGRCHHVWQALSSVSRDPLTRLHTKFNVL